MQKCSKVAKSICLGCFVWKTLSRLSASLGVLDSQIFYLTHCEFYHVYRKLETEKVDFAGDTSIRLLSKSYRRRRHHHLARD